MDKIAIDYCTGCGLCSLICPKNCIQMKENSLGRKIPFINKSICIDCGLCKKKCPQNKVQSGVYPKECYVAWSNNEENRIYSASGGIGAAIAELQTESNQIIVGCDYDDNLNLVYSCTSNIEETKKFRSSKYSHSDAYLIFSEVQFKLDSGSSVVFVGTPCQCIALKGYIKRNSEKLILVDLVCHGVPPTKYLKEHIKKLELNDEIKKIRFRGEHDQKLTLWSKESIIYQRDRFDDSYFKAFYNNIISYDACYFCKYAQPNRLTDLTIGDFWGIGKLNEVHSISDRPSLILINTNKGKLYFNKLKDFLIYEKRPVEEGIRGNGRLNNFPGKNFAAKIFEFFYPKLGFEKSVSITEKFLYCKKRSIVVRNKFIFLKNIIKYKIKPYIKKIYNRK